MSIEVDAEAGQDDRGSSRGVLKTEARDVSLDLSESLRLSSCRSFVRSFACLLLSVYKDRKVLALYLSRR
jgi:hypothetical protein